MRDIQDALYSTTKTFPGAGANNRSTAFDVGTRLSDGASGGILPETVELKIEWPALSALADNKNLLLEVQDSADNTNFANIGLSKTLTGAGGVGVAAGSVQFRLTPTVRRYVAVKQTLDALGGDITGSSSTITLRF